MANVEFSADAIQKLTSIRDYISIRLANPIAAQNIIDKIFSALEQLERFPDSGLLLSTVYNKVPPQFANIRFLVAGNYVAVYDHKGDRVRILQVYHGSEDYIHHLLNTP